MLSVMCLPAFSRRWIVDLSTVCSKKIYENSRRPGNIGYIYEAVDWLNTEHTLRLLIFVYTSRTPAPRSWVSEHKPYGRTYDVSEPYTRAYIRPVEARAASRVDRKTGPDPCHTRELIWVMYRVCFTQRPAKAHCKAPYYTPPYSYLGSQATSTFHYMYR